MKLLSQNNGHIFVCGQTRSGKTYFINRALRQLRDPVLFFNIQDEFLPGYIKMYADNLDILQLKDCLRDGAKVDLRFRAQDSLKTINRVIGYVIMELLGASFSERRPLYVAIDECHLLEGPGLRAAIQGATRGLSRGIRCVFITQRPALADKTLYTQATEQYLFYLAPSENQYMKNKGIDYNYCIDTWNKLGKYSYIYYDGFNLVGRSSLK